MSRQLLSVPKSVKKRRLRHSAQRKFHFNSGCASNLLVQFTSSVQQVKYQGESESVASLITKNATKNLVDHFQQAWDAGKMTFGAFVLHGDLRLGVTDQVLFQAEQVLFQEKLVELIWTQSKMKSWQEKQGEMTLFSMSRGDLNRHWEYFNLPSAGDFRRKLTTVYLKNCLYDHDNELNCDVTGRIGWYIDKNTEQHMFFPISAFDPDIHFTTRLQKTLKDIERIRYSSDIPDIHRCAALLEEVKDMLFLEEFYRALWITEGKGLSVPELKKITSKFTITPIDFHARIDRMKSGECEYFRYDSTNERFFLAKQRQPSYENLERDFEERRAELMRIENLKRYTSAEELNRQYSNLFFDNLPSAFLNPLLYDETLLTQIFKSWSVHGTPSVNAFEDMISIRCQLEDKSRKSLMKQRFPRACKLWRDYIKIHPEDKSLNYEPLLQMTCELGEGGFAMNVLRNRLKLGSVPEHLTLMAIRTMQASRPRARTHKWLSDYHVQGTIEAVLAQPYDCLSPTLSTELLTLAKQIDRSISLPMKSDTLPQVGMALHVLWKSKNPQEVLSLLRSQNVEELSAEECDYIFTPMFKARNGSVRHFATIPAILEGLHVLAKCQSIGRDVKTEYLHDLPALISNISNTEQSCRSVETILKTMENLELHITKQAWRALLQQHLKYSSHLAPLSIDDIYFWINACGPNIRLFNQLLHLVLFNTISQGTRSKLLPHSEADLQENARLVEAIWKSMHLSKCEPNIGTLNLTVDFYTKIGDKEGVFNTLDALAGRVDPDEQTFRIISELYIDADAVQEFVLSKQKEVVDQLKSTVESCQKAFLHGEPRGMLFNDLLRLSRDHWISVYSSGFMFFPRTKDLMSKAILGLERDLVALEDEPRNKLSDLIHVYIQANLPDYRHAFQIKPQVFRNQVMRIIHDAKVETRKEDSAEHAPGFYLNVYDRVRDIINSNFRGQEVSMEEIQHLTRVPSYPFLSTGVCSHSAKTAPLLRWAFSTKVARNEPVINNSSTLKVLQQHDETRATYEMPSSVKIIEEAVLDDDEFEVNLEYKPPLPPQLKALPTMFGQNLLQSSLVLHASDQLTHSRDFSKTILFGLPSGKIEREQSLHNLIHQALNCFTVLQLCQSFISDISHQLALESLTKIVQLKNNLGKSPRRDSLLAEHERLFQEQRSVLNHLVQISGCIQYLNHDRQYHENLTQLHEAYIALNVKDHVLLQEHERILEEEAHEFTADQLARMVQARVVAGKDDTDVTHVFANRIVESKTPVQKPTSENLIEVIDHLQFPQLHAHLESSITTTVPQKYYSNGHSKKRFETSQLEHLVSSAEQNAVTFVSTGNLDRHLFASEVIHSMNPASLGHLLVGFVTHDIAEVEIIDQCQVELAQRVINDPTSLDGSEIDALISCLQYFEIDMGPLLEAQRIFNDKYENEV